MHRLFGLSTKKMANVSRMAEPAVDKLNRKSQLCYLHTLLTIDVLLFDEFGQASAKQVKTLDILLRKICNSNIRMDGHDQLTGKDELLPKKGLGILEIRCFC